MGRADDHNEWGVEVTCISAISGGENNVKATVSIFMSGALGSGKSSLRQRKGVIVAAGDIIPMTQGYQLTVHKIVAPDTTRKIVGWVEFIPQLVVGARR